MQLFHYHLVTSKVRLVEARYIGKLGFGLIARYGWVGENAHWFEQGVSWEELEQMGFRLRLIELGRGAVNVVIQPGHWDSPRVDHLGIALDEDGYIGVLERASELDLKIQDHPGKRTFVATDVGYRIEVHPPRDWIEDLLAEAEELHVAELQLKAEKPSEQSAALADILDAVALHDEVAVGDSLVRFLPDGPTGRPELYGELFG